MSSPRSHRYLAAILVVGLVIGGCGDDEDEPAAADPTTTSADEADGADADDAGDDAGDPAAGSVEVTSVDYAYEGLPDRVATGTMLSLTNESQAEVHELVAFLLPDDEDRSAEELVALPEGELMGILAGPPATVLVAPPSGAPQVMALGDGTLSGAGRYLYFCAIPIGADPDAYLAAAAESTGGPVSVPGGPPHFVEGMYGEVVVE
ncbi:hypothetical protein BH24ACT3_BH24ACT3_15990 [soil metagenome]